MPEPVWVLCDHCHYHAPPRRFRTVDAYACPRCGMDESGLQYEWSKGVDPPETQSYHDRMINQSTQATDAPPPIPDKLDPEEVNMARREFRTDPDVREKVEELAERVRIVVYGEDDAMIDFLEDKAGDYFPTLIELHCRDLTKEEMDKALDLEAQAQDVLIQVMLQMLKPFVHRILDKGDWRDDGIS